MELTGQRSPYWCDLTLYPGTGVEWNSTPTIHNDSDTNDSDPSFTQAIIMSKVYPYYSVSADDPKVYHDHDDCPSGKQIKEENKRYGTDDRDRCDHCKSMG